MKAVRPLLFLIILLLFASASFAQTADELRSSIRTAVEQDRTADALNALKTFEQKFPEDFRSGDLDYLAARISAGTGDTAAAAARYLAVVKRGSILKPYALFHLAAIARESGNLVLERTYLDEIAAFSPTSLPADAARNRRARSWFESGNYDMAAKAFAGLLSSSGKPQDKTADSITRENRLYLARANMLLGNTAAAREMLTTLMTTGTNPAQPDDHALAAVRILDKLDAADGASGLSDYEHLRRASVYQFNRDFADARAHYSSIIRDHPTSGILPDAIFQIGRSHAQEGNYPEAINWFERVLEQFPEHPIARDALLQAASAYARVGKHHEGIRRYQDFIAKYPDDEGLDRAYLNIIDVLRDQDQDTEAMKWCAKAQEVFRGKPGEALALFSEIKVNIARSDWNAALLGLDRLLTLPNLGGASVPGGTNRSEATFLRGYVLEQKRNFPAAIDAYLSIPDGRNEYYGGRATERLQELARNDAAKASVESRIAALPLDLKDQEANRRNVQAVLRLTAEPEQRARLLEVLRRIYTALPAYKSIPAFGSVDVTKAPAKPVGAAVEAAEVHKAVAARLISLGLYDEAAPEAEASQTAPAASNAAYSTAVLNNRGNRSYKAVAFAEPLWASVPADYQIELIPADHISLLYPAPYRDALRKHSQPRSVDPRFLLSIVRQESRYRPDIKSYAAARGMMQFISTTSNKIAAELNRADFDQDELYDPSTAILFGSQYVADLFKLFPNQPEAVAGSYNGGEDNIRRWINRSRSESADRYVAEIAFSQSKDYVYKVMANYRVYRIFYNEDLSTR